MNKLYRVALVKATRGSRRRLLSLPGGGCPVFDLTQEVESEGDFPVKKIRLDERTAGQLAEHPDWSVREIKEPTKKAPLRTRGDHQ